MHVYFTGGDRVGLIVRGKTSHEHDPSVFAQHADCILSNGAPVGFFGTGNAGSSASAPASSGAPSRKSGQSPQKSGIGMTGIVYDATGLARNRANYVDLGVARATKTVSMVLLVRVSAAEAAAFDAAWNILAVIQRTYWRQPSILLPTDNPKAAPTAHQPIKLNAPYAKNFLHRLRQPCVQERLVR